MTDSSALDQLRREFVDEAVIPVADADFERMRRECGNPPDTKRLGRYLRRRQLGEPLEYILGFQEFRGVRFSVDKRVYITDPEATHLVDKVIEVGHSLMEQKGRPPTIVEMGVGCGSLAISVKTGIPEAEVIGVDLDSDAIAVAMKNVNLHHADVMLFESDLFSGLPSGTVPDLIFADPPWGDADSIYDETRPASHYEAMPVLSAFPVGGITAVHEAILEDVARRKWTCPVVMNLGILGKEHRDRLEGMAATREVFEFDKAKVLLSKLSH